jgi:hypothetical protein
VFGPFRTFVDEIVAVDETAPRKQRHTDTQIYRRLVAEKGYTGKYDPVRRYLPKKRLARRETFLPLEHWPVTRAEADFGHIHPDGRRQVTVLIVSSSPGVIPTRRSPSPCRPNAPKRSCTDWLA